MRALPMVGAAAEIRRVDDYSYHDQLISSSDFKVRSALARRRRSFK